MVSPTVIGLMATQRGLVTRAQAVAAGTPPECIDRLVRAGSWVAVRRAVYAEQSLWATLSGWEERQLIRDRAASLRITKPHVMSHTSSALELGLAILRPEVPMTHVTRRGVHGTRHEFGVKHHLAPYREDQVVARDRVPVLDAARTAVDIAREHGLRAGVVACDSARRSGTSKSALVAACTSMRSWPEVTVVREAVELSDAGSDSVGETLARELVTQLGHGRPETQFGLTDGHREVWCDLRIGRHIIEFDGKVKYRPSDRGGVATVDPDEVVWREKQRQDFVCGFKLGMSRVVWSDFWVRPEAGRSPGWRGSTPTPQPGSATTSATSRRTSSRVRGVAPSDRPRRRRPSSSAVACVRPPCNAVSTQLPRCCRAIRSSCFDSSSCSRLRPRSASVAPSTSEGASPS